LLFLFSYFGLKNFLYGQAPFCTDVSVFAEILSLFYKKSHEIKIKDLTQTQFRTSVHHNSHTNRFFNCAHFLSLEER
jgi:hypothetical protein